MELALGHWGAQLSLRDIAHCRCPRETCFRKLFEHKAGELARCQFSALGRCYFARAGWALPTVDANAYPRTPRREKNEVAFGEVEIGLAELREKPLDDEVDPASGGK